MGEKEQVDAFLMILIAAMQDAAGERKLTQLKAMITPPGFTKPQPLRIVVMPETMDMEWTKPVEMKR